ncbi:MAG: hypothetical protein JO332_05035 [Planctomycetaceae bacterium]|nr:hypothetical protein [Planctomycetaceae bacterium]
MIAWWEKRRIAFNILVGLYGLVALVLFYCAILGSDLLSDGEDAFEPTALIVAPIVINVLYILGWMVEISLRSIWPSLSPTFGPVLLSTGLGLGFVLSMIPATVVLGYRLY